ncbi:hypothetical protein AALO_G00252530 [Alosa alosa]|uniref:Uncharacterized protein n=1 Tax=Alosa alosa TaxID=278164 RepID=A0AAV6FND7_9TELE|nr:uncharacterized protein si:ch73-345f18.3 [Alosa alosa]KAG5264329.1 hypothetical protein AALO_G00252530 [Alosa alosa]
MSFMNVLCCCFSSSENSTRQLNERQPLLQGQPQSARQARPAHNETPQKSGRFIARDVGIPELDQSFKDVAEIFNLQQGHHEAMTECLNTLRDRYGCSCGDGLSECLKRIKEEHDTHHQITFHMKGYDFSLAVVPNDEVPSKLRSSQDNIRGLCQASKAIVAAGTKLQEMIGWLTKTEEQLANQVLEEAPAYQEQQRLEDNLKKNLQECRRARELSTAYREQAGKILNEAALLSGVNP